MSSGSIREAIERNRALYRADPVAFERETKELIRALPVREPDPIYPWEPDVDPRERDLVERRTLLEVIRDR